MGYGVYAFIKRGFCIYMFLQTQFVFFDYTELLVFFIIDYVAVMVLFAGGGYFFRKKESNIRSGKSKTTSTSGKSATNATNAPKTGDEGDMILWGSMVMVSLAALVTAVIAGRKRTGRKKRIRRQF